MDGWPTDEPLQERPTSSPQYAGNCRFSIVLPAFNEEQAIERVLAELIEALAGESPPYEIVVVDDASTDRTADLAERFAADTWPCPVRVLRMPARRGAGAARKVGIRAARGDVVVMLDADGTYSAESIPELLRHFPAYDQVNGARTSEQGSCRWLRAPVKWVIRNFACLLAGRRIPDLNTGLKAFKRDAMLPWLWIVPDGFSCVTTMTLTFLANGYKVRYVPTEYRPRIGNSKFHPLKDTAAYLSTILRIVLYFRPLRIFAPLAVLWLALGMLLSAEARPTVLATGFLTGLLGLVAESVAAGHRSRQSFEATELPQLARPVVLADAQ